MTANPFLHSRAFLRQHTAVFLGRAVPCAGLGDTPSSRHSPFRIDFGEKVGMELFHPFAVLELVLSGEYLLVRKLAVLDWQKRTVDVRVQLVQMYNEGGYIQLAVSAAHERIDIFRPAFDVAFPFDA